MYMQRALQRETVVTEIASNGQGSVFVDTNRNYNITTVKPDRAWIPHSWYNIKSSFDRIVFYTNSANPDGSVLLTVSLGESNRDIDSIIAAIQSGFSLPGITATITTDNNLRLVITITAGAPTGLGLHYDLSTASRYIGLTDNVFGVESPPGTWTITTQRSINLVWPRAIYLRINDNYFLLPTRAPFGEYEEITFPDNERVTNSYQSNQIDIEITDHNYEPLDLRGHNWFLQMLVEGYLR